MLTRVACIALACVCAALPSLASRPASASSAVTVVDAATSVTLIDTSGDGRYVLTQTPIQTSAELRVESHVVDRLTGERSTLPSVAGGALKIAGDGSDILFISIQQLVAADTDDLWDIYDIDRLTGAITLVTGGLPGWEFTTVGDIDFDGGRAIISGWNQSQSRSAVFLFAGGSATELGTSLAKATLVTPLGLSANGRRALYLSNGGCSDAQPCAERRMYLDDVTDLANVQTSPIGRRQADGALVDVDSPMNVALSADGQWIVALDVKSGTVYRGSTESTNSMVPVGTDGSPSTLGYARGVSVSADGSKFTYLRTTTVRNEYGSFTSRQLFVSDGDASGFASFPTRDGQVVNSGEVTTGILSDDGTVVLFGPNYLGIAGGAVFARPIPIDLPLNTPSYFTARTPLRILDTRADLGYSGDRPGSNTTIVVPLGGRYGIPSTASAVAVQLTAAEGNGIGFLSAFPTSGQRPLVSNLNLDVAGETVANMAIVPIGVDGSISVYTMAPTHVIVDLLGWWTPVFTGKAAAGRFRPVGPNRILDTRAESVINSDGVKPAARSTTVLQVTGRGGVPAAGVGAVSVNITVVNPDGPGYVQAAPAASLTVGASSSLNVTTRGQIVAGSTIVPVDAQGRIAIFTQTSADLVVDVGGWFTDQSAPLGGDGMFVPRKTPGRVLDTRELGGPFERGTRHNLDEVGAALVGNVTVTGGEGAGYVQLGPSRTMINGATSSINTSGPNETVANSAIVPIDDGLSVYTNTRTDVILDTSGYMTAG